MSPSRPVILPLVALGGGLVRWWFQGAGNVYTDADKRFYVPDPDLGWRAREDGPVWLGLEALGVIAAIALGVVVLAWLVHRLERRRGGPRRWLRASIWALAALPLVIPVWAFASGGRPEGGVDRLPRDLAVAPDSGFDGALPGLPAGGYTVIAHPGTAITARLSAGGESFDARFAHDLGGWWRGAPGDLTRPMRAEIWVASSAVDTGVALRSRHAREDYLRAAEFPRIGFVLTRLFAARATADGGVAFRGEGIVTLMGQEHAVEIAGTMRAPGGEARGRLGLSGSDAILLVSASFELHLHETALAGDAADFDGDLIPIDVSLLLLADAGDPA